MNYLTQTKGYQPQVQPGATAPAEQDLGLAKKIQDLLDEIAKEKEEPERPGLCMPYGFYP